MPKRYYVYILTNRSRTLYVGITNNLRRRLWQHKYDAGSAFTSRYHIDRLVWFEEHHDVRHAIARATEIKGWTRAKKMALIVAQNPTWRDLSQTGPNRLSCAYVATRLQIHRFFARKIPRSE